MKAILDDGMLITDKIVTCNNDKEIHRSKEKITTMTNERNPRSVLFLPKKRKDSITLEPRGAKLYENSMGLNFVVKEFEQDFVDKILHKR